MLLHAVRTTKSGLPCTRVSPWGPEDIQVPDVRVRVRSPQVQPKPTPPLQVPSAAKATMHAVQRCRQRTSATVLALREPPNPVNYDTKWLRLAKYLVNYSIGALLGGVLGPLWGSLGRSRKHLDAVLDAMRTKAACLYICPPPVPADEK